MHPDYPEPGSPEDWLRYARSDLEIARVTRSGDMLQEEYEQALRIAEQILKWAEQMLEKQTTIQEEAQASSDASICDHDINSNHR